jgi:hypothetical protein
MFKPYVNHAAQYLADGGDVAGEGSPSNNLHFNTPSLQSSINITKSVENTTRQIPLCDFVSSCEIE